MRSCLRTGATAGLAIAFAALGSADAAASFRIDHASVPGIGRIELSLPTDTKVRSPGYIPESNGASSKELDQKHAREMKIARTIRKGPDVGPAEKVSQIKHDVPRGLFLRYVAYSCRPLPKAGLWVYQYTFARPNRKAHVDLFETNRRDSIGDTAVCERRRLRVDRWEGVRVDRTDGRRAHVMVRGLEESRRSGERWNPTHAIWKLAVRRVDERWRIAVLYEEHPNPDETGSG